MDSFSRSAQHLTDAAYYFCPCFQRRRIGDRSDSEGSDEDVEFDNDSDTSLTDLACWPGELVVRPITFLVETLYLHIAPDDILRQHPLPSHRLTARRAVMDRYRSVMASAGSGIGMRVGCGATDSMLEPAFVVMVDESGDNDGAGHTRGDEIVCEATADVEAEGKDEKENEKDNEEDDENDEDSGNECGSFSMIAKVRDNDDAKAKGASRGPRSKDGTSLHRADAMRTRARGTVVRGGRPNRVGSNDWLLSARVLDERDSGSDTGPTFAKSRSGGGDGEAEPDSEPDIEPKLQPRGAKGPIQTPSLEQQQTRAPAGQQRHQAEMELDSGSEQEAMLALPRAQGQGQTRGLRLRRGVLNGGAAGVTGGNNGPGTRGRAGGGGGGGGGMFSESRRGSGGGGGGSGGNAGGTVGGVAAVRALVAAAQARGAVVGKEATGTRRVAQDWSDETGSEAGDGGAESGGGGGERAGSSSPGGLYDGLDWWEGRSVPGAPGTAGPKGGLGRRRGTRGNGRPFRGVGVGGGGIGGGAGVDGGRRE